MRRLAGAGALIAALVLAACGGGGGAPPKNGSPGLRVFDEASCGSCHTLAVAQASAGVGPKLDGATLDSATVARFVRDGGGGMPPFKDQLSAKEIQQVADFVSRASRWLRRGYLVEIRRIPSLSPPARWFRGP